MGSYLNPGNALFKMAVNSQIFIKKNFDYPEKTLKYKHIRRISD